jgi:hypothetical protein
VVEWCAIAEHSILVLLIDWISAILCGILGQEAQVLTGNSSERGH